MAICWFHAQDSAKTVQQQMCNNYHTVAAFKLPSLKTKNSMAKKSLCVTYILWLLLGWFGVHHFYLGRDRHAFAWWSTFGGIFTLGWIRDIWRIPIYVADANEDATYIDELTTLMRTRRFPQFKIIRFLGQLLVGYFYGSLVKLALPVDELPILLVDALVCFGISCGVHLVGNIGRHQGRFFNPFIVTLLCNFFVRYYIGDHVSGFICTFVSSMTFSYFREYRRVYKKRTLCKRMTIFSSCMFIIFALWLSFFYFNAEVTIDNGETIKVRDSVNHFFKSRAWMEFKDTMWELYEHGKQHGWKNLYNEFVKALDPKGEANARKVLEVDQSASVDEIKKVYKKLVRKWHPDKHKENKEAAQQRFMVIQNAYDILTSKKSSEWRTEDRTTKF